VAKTKMLRAEVTQAEYLDHEGGDDGFCTACGEWTCGGCEPDARRYECESCGERAVYGAQELLFMGLIVLTDGDD
jgi:hypothetical protein